jgi:hypothetical protein
MSNNLQYIRTIPNILSILIIQCSSLFEQIILPRKMIIALTIINHRKYPYIAFDIFMQKTISKYTKITQLLLRIGRDLIGNTK